MYYHMLNMYYDIHNIYFHLYKGKYNQFVYRLTVNIVIFKYIIYINNDFNHYVLLIYYPKSKFVHSKLFCFPYLEFPCIYSYNIRIFIFYSISFHLFYYLLIILFLILLFSCLTFSWTSTCLII